MKYWKPLFAVYQLLIAAFILYVFASQITFAGLHNIRWLKFFCMFLILIPVAVLCFCNAIRLLRTKPFLAQFSSLGILSYIVTVLMTVLICHVFIEKHSSTKNLPPWTKVKAGFSAPDFTLKDLSGNSVTLSNLRGKFVLLDFWGIWCGPCLRSLPHVQTTFEKFNSKGLMVLAIHDRFDTEKIAPFLSEKHYTFTAVIDPCNVSKDYGISAVPTYFLVDPSGTIIWGPQHSPPADDYIESILNTHAASDANRIP